LLTGFVSVRTRRKFSAFLVRGADGKIGFEFEKKAPRKKSAAGEKASAAPGREVMGEDQLDE
jgi:DNA topoisomerase-3